MTDDFTPWLRARLDAREALARAAAAEYPGDSGLHWEARHGSVGPANPVDSNPVADAAGWGSLADATAAHIADNDPHHVLTQVDTTRRILDAYEQTEFGDFTRRSTLEEVISLLAASFADQPGYRPEWSTQ